MTKPKIILIGAGGHCRSCIDVIEQEGRFEIFGVVDKVEQEGENTILGYPVIGTDDDLPALRKECKYALVTVGQIKSPVARVQLFKRLKELGFRLPIIVSPKAYVSQHAEVGEGTIVMHQAVVNANARVGDNCILNTQCLVEHDADIGNNVHVSTGAIINGDVKVGDDVFIGSNAVSAQGISIIEGSFVKAGDLARGDCL